jgi:hypothetical protein
MLGIMLAVKTSLGGDQLVFRYPPVVRRQLTQETLSRLQPQRTSTVTASSGPSSLSTRFVRESPAGGVPSGGDGGGAGGGGGGVGGGVGGVGGGGSSSASGLSSASSGGASGNVAIAASSQPSGGSGSTTIPTMGSGVRSASHEPYQMSSVILAHVLIPKRSLCNSAFSMTIGDTHFYGFPKLLTAAPWIDGSSSASSASALAGSASSLASSAVSLSVDLEALSTATAAANTARVAAPAKQPAANKDELLIFNVSFVTAPCDEGTTNSKWCTKHRHNTTQHNTTQHDTTRHDTTALLPLALCQSRTYRLTRRLALYCT